MKIIYSTASQCLFHTTNHTLIQISIDSNQDIISFDLPFKNSQYIKGDAFVRMNCDTNDCRSASHKVQVITYGEK